MQILKEKQNINAVALSRIYGYMPKDPVHLSYTVEQADPEFAAGKASLIHNNLIIDLGEKEIYLPIVSVIPSKSSPSPAVIFLSYEREIPNKFLPVEEIVDRGYAVFSICIKDISENDGNFKSGISQHIAKSRRKKSSAGKIAVWAWAALRVAEYARSLDYVDKSAIAVAGHGILARSAMLAAGLNNNIKYVIANGLDSLPMPYEAGNASGAISLCENPHLYCPDFAECPCGNEYLSLISHCKDKSMLIGSAEDGISLNAINKVIPTARDLAEGDISYHTRPGSDYFSREDWNIYLSYIDSKIGRNLDF